MGSDYGNEKSFAMGTRIIANPVSVSRNGKKTADALQRPR